jgi:type IV secretory pathway VirB10-like protein
MRPMPPPPATPPRPFLPRYPWLPVTRLRVGRVVLLAFVTFVLLVGGAAWLLWTQTRQVTLPSIDSTAWPAWMRQAQTYPPSEPLLPKPAEAVTDPLAGLHAKLAAMLAELERQRQELEALKKRPSGTTIVQPQPQQAAKVTPPPKANASMLFVAHELKDPPSKPTAAEYTLAPGATKLPCVVETAINSDVEGYFTAKVSTNVYDTKTGRHLLVPQGSTILGHDQSSALLYGNERLPTISLTLTLPDGRSVDLGQAPVTDQHGIAGLTGRVHQHWWRLFGAVFIGGALRGGMQALQLEMASAAGAGQVAAGISSVGNQAVTQRIGRALDTRPTIEVDAGQLCNVLLTKPLSLQAVWQ